MHKTLKEIAECIGGEIVGDDGIVIKGVAGIKEAVEGDLTFLANPKYFPLLEKTRASAVITSRDVGESKKTIIRTDNPSLAFSQVLTLISPKGIAQPKGIHPSAIVGKQVTLGKNVSLGPYVVVEDGALIGDNTVVYAGTFIGAHTKIGSDTLIYPHVSIREHITIGSRVIIHSGTVIGSDGFGFVTIKGEHFKIPQIGTVEIGDDVEIGANVTIDRARFDKTIIAKGTKIDNLVQIAHNVSIGENSIIVSQVGIAGSTVIGKNVTLAGQSGVVGHISIGDNAIVMAGSGVSKPVAENETVFGYPARRADAAKKAHAALYNLPRLYKTITELKIRIETLEEKLKKHS